MRMWTYKHTRHKGDRQFFLIGFCDLDLLHYYKTQFYLMHHHNFQLSELENMMPWEYEIYQALLIEELNKQNKK
jgi:hypothetical protein